MISAIFLVLFANPPFKCFKLKVQQKNKNKKINNTLPKFIVLLQYIGDYLIWQLTPLTNFNTPSYLTCPFLTDSLFLLTALLASQSILHTNFFLWCCPIMSLLKTIVCICSINLLNMVPALHQQPSLVKEEEDASEERCLTHLHARTHSHTHTHTHRSGFYFTAVDRI